jgi:hypothetical protein
MIEVQNWIFDLCNKYTGNSNPNLTDRVFSDLRINGYDFVEFFSEIDKKFNVKTRLLTEMKNGDSFDPSIIEIIHFIQNL